MTDRSTDVNLRELRNRLSGQIAFLIIGTGSVLAVTLLLQEPFPAVRFSLLVALAALGKSVQSMQDSRDRSARAVLVWGMTVELLVAMWLVRDPWVPFLALPLVFVGAFLVPSASYLGSGLVLALAVGLTLSGVRSYPLRELASALTCSVILSWLVVRTLCTALEWAWTMQKRSDDLLEVARDRQAELARSLKSMNITISVLNRTRGDLVSALKQAREARVMKEQFAANVSHEFRTPLNIVLGFSETMYVSPEIYGDFDWPSDLREDIYQVYWSSRHLLDMVNDVLDLSRIEMVGFTLRKESTELEPFLQDTLEVVGELFRSHVTKLSAHIESDLPAMEIDRIRIRQVLLNLLNNAARHTPDGEVQLCAKRVDDEVWISVHDTGVGIPKDKLDHLFEEFYQVDRSMSNPHRGIGLGLAISRHFVRAHDGRIWATSEEGVGSTFTFTLPVPENYVPLSRLQKTTPGGVSSVTARHPVFVIDADEGVASLIQRHLEDTEVIWVKSPEHLREKIETHRPRAVILNVPPGADTDMVGQQLLSSSLPPSVPLIQCSLPSQTWLINDLSAQASLNKPITSQQLLQTVNKIGDVHDVLVIDDNWGFCQMVARMLETSAAGYQVRCFDDGIAGLAALHERMPDLLLLDLVMPGIDGFQILGKMRRDPELSKLPVILLTAASCVEDALQQRNNRMLVQRSQGFSAGEILVCLDSILHGLEPQYTEEIAGSVSEALRLDATGPAPPV